MRGAGWNFCEYIPELRTESGLNTVNNKFYNNSGGVVGGTKTSSTKIGAEMEIDSKIAGSDWKGYNDRYYEYTLRFKPLRGSTPFAFYAGDRDSLMNNTVLNYVTAFLNY